MKQRRLGKTGLTVSEICLGTMTFGSMADEETSRAILDKAFEAGVDFYDTAEVYPVPPMDEKHRPHRKSRERMRSPARDLRRRLDANARLRRLDDRGRDEPGSARRAFACAGREDSGVCARGV
jgi:hypothetical protein